MTKKDKKITNKRILTIITLIGIVAGFFTFAGCEPVDEIPVLPVQLMSREGNEWTGFFNSSTIDINGNGEYSGIINVTGDPTIFPMIIISAVGTDVEDEILRGAVEAPQEYKDAAVTINFVKINGDLLTLIDNQDIQLVKRSGKLKGYANVQIWNAWDKPGQRIVTKETSITIDGGEALEFDDPVKSIEINFTVSGVTGSSAPAPTIDVDNKNNDNNKSPDDPVEEEDEAFDIEISGDFNSELTAKQLVEQIALGWNLGNTLDAYGSSNPADYKNWVGERDSISEIETAWIGGTENLTTQDLFKKVKNAGFNAVRIPVTWYKMAGDAPDYTINEDWVERVQKIVNMAVSEDLYIILNTHHDEFIMRFDEDPAVGEGAVTALWTQIAKTFKDYNEKLIFEGLNEPRARTNGWDTRGEWDWNGSDDKYNTINRWNQAFVNAVRATGGNNEQRHLMLATYGAQPRSNMLNGFELPVDPIEENGISRFIMSVHTYSPHNWAHNGIGTYNDDDSLSVQLDIERVANRAADLGIPVILGEWGTLAENDHELRVQHAHDYIRIATEMRSRDDNPVVMACFWWDDHGDFSLISRTKSINGNGLEIIRAMKRAQEGLPLDLIT